MCGLIFLFFKCESITEVKTILPFPFKDEDH